MNLNEQQRELVAIGASIGAGCHPCLEHHLGEAARLGLAQPDLLQAVADAECVKRSSYNELAARGRELLGESAELPPSCCDETSVMKEFVSVGSAVGANSVAQLRKHIDQARGVGIGAEQIELAVRIAESIQRHAAEVTAKAAAGLLQPAKQRSSNTDPQWLIPAAVTPASDSDCGSDCVCREESAQPAAVATATVGGGISEGACGCGDQKQQPAPPASTGGKSCC
jgi:AhpD family alkylhydroperoxidase